MKRVLVTGVAGFIGFHLSQRLLDLGHQVVGWDNLNDYYDVSLKEARLAQLTSPLFQFQRVELANRSELEALFIDLKPDWVVHLAAQAGIRYSLTQPHAYVDSNLVGFLNLLEGCRHQGCQHFVFASSSSVYGSNRKIPFSTTDPVNTPISLYAATKRANELMAYSYSHLYQIPCTGLRFFTVYGPWGRPDMAYFLFTRSIFNGDAIKIFNNGQMYRDFTYIEDIVEGILRVLEQPPRAQLDQPPYRLYNIGNNQPVSLLKFIQILETLIGKTAEKLWLPLQPGDMIETFADIDDLIRDTGFKPTTSLETGLKAFVDWYRLYYKI